MSAARIEEEFVTEAEIRQFLLGAGDDSERERIERLFISDGESHQKIEIAEDELIEDYLENSLKPADRDRFLRQYASTRIGRRKLRIAKSIREYAVSQAKLNETAGMTAKPHRFLAGWRPRNLRLIIPVAAVLTLACVAGVFWLAKFNHQRLEESNRRLAIERELAELNRPSNLNVKSSQLTSLVLVPGSSRGVESQIEVKPGGNIRVVELNLLWIRNEQYPSYQAVIRRSGSDEEFRVSGLHAENILKSGNAIRVRLPTHLLREGAYRVILTGLGSDGAAGADEEYSFVVA